MSIVILPPSRSLPPPRQWTGSAACAMRLLDANHNSAVSAWPSRAPEQRATPLVH